MRSLLAALLALFVPLGALVGGRIAADRAEHLVATPYAARSDWPVVIDVPSGTSAASVAQRLQDERLVADARVLRAWLQVTGLAGRLQAGEYGIEGPASVVDVADLLVSGRVLLHQVTIPEGLSLVETARKAAASGLWSEDDLLAAFRDPSPILGRDSIAPDLEGYLFPETYSVPRGLTAAQLAAAMVARFESEWTGAGGDLALARHPVPAAVRSVRDAVALASLVEEETPVPDERRVVASVYVNRLRRGMKLECDATVIYALQRDGQWTGGPLQIKDLPHPSIYNTYVIPGLPPGPIASPGRESIRAALEPAETAYLYYVATGTGGHRFGETSVEHLRNVALYRRQQRDAKQGP